MFKSVVVIVQAVIAEDVVKVRSGGIAHLHHVNCQGLLLIPAIHKNVPAVWNEHASYAVAINQSSVATQHGLSLVIPKKK